MKIQEFVLSSDMQLQKWSQCAKTSLKKCLPGKKMVEYRKQIHNLYTDQNISSNHLKYKYFYQFSWVMMQMLPNYKHMPKQMAMFSCSKLQFLFICEQKQLARVLPESSAVICARFSGISTNFTATITKCFKKVFCELFFKKAKILLFVTNR